MVAASALAITAAILLDCLMTFLGSTANDDAFNAWLVDLTDETNRGRVVAVQSLLGGLAVAIPGGILADRMGRRPVALAAVLLESIGLILFSNTKAVLPLTLYAIVWVSGTTLWGIALGAWAKDLLPEDKRGQFTGYVLVFNVLIPMVIGPFIGSRIISHYGIPMTIDGKAGFIPTPEIFRFAALASLLALWPILAAKRKEGPVTP